MAGVVPCVYVYLFVAHYCAILWWLLSHSNAPQKYKKHKKKKKKGRRIETQNERRKIMCVREVFYQFSTWAVQRSCCSQCYRSAIKEWDRVIGKSLSMTSLKGFVVGGWWKIIWQPMQIFYWQPTWPMVHFVCKKNSASSGDLGLFACRFPHICSR